LYLTLFALPGFGATGSSGRNPVSFAQVSAPTSGADDSPDALYAGREDLAKARRALEIWNAQVSAAPSNFEAAWKASRARYWLGHHDALAARRAHLEAGVQVGRAAAALEPGRAEGHFWAAANMGALAESFGLRQGLKYRAAIRESLERARASDPSYLGGAPDRALGRWYFKVPGLFGGSNENALMHLQRSLTYKADSTVTRYFLAETLLDMDRTAEARTELQRVIDAPFDPDWAPEDREWKAKARALMGRIRE